MAQIRHTAHIFNPQNMYFHHAKFELVSKISNFSAMSPSEHIGGPSWFFTTKFDGICHSLRVSTEFLSIYYFHNFLGFSPPRPQLAGRRPAAGLKIRNFQNFTLLRGSGRRPAASQRPRDPWSLAGST